MELKFQLKAIHNQMQEYQPGAQKTTLPEKFEYNSGPDVTAQGKKSGVEEKIPEDRAHVRHLIKWAMKDKKLFLEGFGFNYLNIGSSLVPSLLCDQVGYTRMSFKMGRLENPADLSRTLLNRSYTIIGHRKDIIIKNRGALHLLSVEGKLISTEEEFKDWKKKHVSIPEEKEERNQTRRDNTRRSQTQGGARFKWRPNQEDRDLYLPSDSEYDYIGDDKHQYESLKAGTKVREAC